MREIMSRICTLVYSEGYSICSVCCVVCNNGVFGDCLQLLLSCGCSGSGLEQIVWVCCLLGHLVSGFACCFLGCIYQVLNLVFMIFQGSSQNMFVEDVSTIEVWDQKPAKEGQANVMPVRNTLEKETDVSFKCDEESEDHPVGEPHFVVFSSLSLNCSD